MSDWITNRIIYLRALKAPTEQQKLLLKLVEMTTRTAKEEKILKTLIAAEKADERAKKARAEAARMLDGEKSAARKARDHNLYQTAGLLILAGLVDGKTGEPVIDRASLLGGLINIAKLRDHEPEIWNKWKRSGEEKLAEIAARKKHKDSAEVAQEHREKGNGGDRLGDRSLPVSETDRDEDEAGRLPHS